jgi:hypothetical protein
VPTATGSLVPVVSESRDVRHSAGWFTLCCVTVMMCPEWSFGFSDSTMVFIPAGEFTMSTHSVWCFSPPFP